MEKKGATRPPPLGVGVGVADATVGCTFSRASRKRAQFRSQRRREAAASRSRPVSNVVSVSVGSSGVASPRRLAPPAAPQSEASRRKSEGAAARHCSPRTRRIHDDDE